MSRILSADQPAQDGVASFLGIPYAASPAGPLRFRAPAPPQAWDGIRDASSLGATPPEPGYAAPFDVLLSEPNIAGDDWLNLNVWAAGPAGEGPSGHAVDPRRRVRSEERR